MITIFITPLSSSSYLSSSLLSSSGSLSIETIVQSYRWVWSNATNWCGYCWFLIWLTRYDENGNDDDGDEDDDGGGDEYCGDDEYDDGGGGGDDNEYDDGNDDDNENDDEIDGNVCLSIFIRLIIHTT